MLKHSFIFLLMILTIDYSLHSQEVTEKKEVAVFALSYYDWSIPSGALGMVDDEIKKVFVQLGRFDIIGMPYRLSSEDINDFINRIRRTKEDNIEIPEEVRLGEEVFTERDFNRLVGSFIVVIPVMSYYNLTRTKGGDYIAEIQTSFTFVNVEELKTIAGFSLRTTGIDDTPRSAVRKAVDDIPVQLTYEIRKIPEFQLKTGIIEVMGRDVLIEFGRNMGVKKGDEFVITKPRILGSGHLVNEERGLLVIKDVKEEISVAHLIYSAEKPNIGEQVKELPRLGFDSFPYFHMVVDLSDPVFFIGIRQSITRGVYRIRPLFGLEVPLSAGMERYGWYGLPLNLFFGGELNWYLGRLQIVPMASLGLGTVLTSGRDETLYLTHGGFKTTVSINYLVGKSVRFSLDGGYTYWFSGQFEDYGGILAGLGMVIKY
ncbi:MAG: hypothetical protein DRP87_13840 [Spirochaetes bacterium]|nr:MAG: hypothetical protein DRP87_13840 [Spirochaetota bacterium]